MNEFNTGFCHGLFCLLERDNTPTANFFKYTVVYSVQVFGFGEFLKLMDEEVEDRSQIRVVIQKPKPTAKSLSSPVIAESEISQPAQTIHVHVLGVFDMATFTVIFFLPGKTRNK